MAMDTMKAVILAGGLGTRLKDCVPDLPKVMAPVGRRPFLEYLLDRLAAGGISEVILSVGYKAEVIMKHFGDRYKRLPIRYAVEKEPLCTGGAAAYALAGCEDEPALVLNGDTYLEIDYSELIHWYRGDPSEAAMVLRRTQDVARYGSVLCENGRVTGFLEKGRDGAGFVNAGVYILKPSILSRYHLPAKFSIESDLWQRYHTELRLRAYETEAYFIDIGIPEDYERANKEMAKLTRQLPNKKGLS